MNKSNLEYIFKNIKSNKMNIYKSIPTLNTMKQYLNLTKSLGYNYSEDIGKNNQKAVILKRIDGTVIGELKNSMYPSNHKEGIRLVMDKMLTENLLRKSNVNTTHSRLYLGNQCSRAKKEFFQGDSDRTAVIKPTDMSQGKGVNVGFGYKDFEYYWENTKNEMYKYGKRKIEILLQEYIEGFEARAVVIEGKLISVVARVPAHVVGDGINNIKKLIDQKNKLRKTCAHLRHKPIKFDARMERYIENSGFKINEIPRKNEYILLTSVSNTSLGGDMVDITNEVSEEVKNIAVNAIAAIPGLFSGGVDIMMKNFEDENPYAIEINSWPMLQSTIYPTYGLPHNPQKYFLDSYFARDQFLNKPNKIYNIQNSEEFIKNYLDFLQLKTNMHKAQMMDSL